MLFYELWFLASRPIFSTSIQVLLPMPLIFSLSYLINEKLVLLAIFLYYILVLRSLLFTLSRREFKCVLVSFCLIIFYLYNCIILSNYSFYYYRIIFLFRFLSMFYSKSAHFVKLVFFMILDYINWNLSNLIFLSA